MALGSVKSNIGHLKGAAGAAGILKAALALHHKVLPPSLNFERPNPNVDWSASPFAVNTELREWEPRNGDPRVAGVSAFGFGGTNFHAVLEEHVPGRLNDGGRDRIAVSRDVAGGELAGATASAGEPAAASGTASAAAEPKAPLRGALVLGAADEAGLAAPLKAALAEAEAGNAPPPAAPEEAALRAPERVAIDYGDSAELAQKAGQALKALESGNPAAWKALRARGHLPRPAAPPGKVAFLYTGQGSQYANMRGRAAPGRAGRRRDLRGGRQGDAPAARRPAAQRLHLRGPRRRRGDGPRPSADLMRTEITQPAVLAVDIALTRLLAAYGIVPDFVMGHSLGEYAALVAAGVLPFEEALEAVSARGREMASLELDDPGAMAAVSAPLEEVEEIMGAVDGYAVIANVNSTHQVVIGGATEPVERAVAATGRARPPGDPAAGQPRLPHRDRRPRLRAAAGDAAPAPRLAAGDPGRRQRRRRVLPDGARRRGAR